MRLWPMALLALAQLAAATPEAEFFESKVRPVLARCYGCHAENATAGLRLDSRAGLLKGGRSGPAIQPGDPGGSILLHAIQGIKGRMGMPPAGQRIEAHAVEALEQWIAMGAPWPMSPREFLQARVKPVLESKCFGCHLSEPQGGLRMDSLEALLKGGNSGPALVKGDPDASLLVKAVRYQHDLKMPPTGPLPADEAEDIARWIADGAAWTDDGGEALQPYEISEEHRQHWAFQPLRQGAVPVPAGADDSADAIDRFLLARLEREGLKASPLAGKRTMIRRLTFDLTGLPPTPQEITDFLADESQTAYADLVERLLRSPHYGERWGRHWLDLVRYADTAGDSGDFPVPEAYKYRNYVIDAFQGDKPYDDFIREQIAGDLLPSDSEPERWNKIVATGYLAISRRIGVSPHRLRHITLEDTIDNLGKTFLGLSVQCARCHDHKFDPIPTADYYALYGILDSSVFPSPGAEHLPYRSNFVYRVGADKAREVLAEYEQGITSWNDREREKFREYQSFQNMLITTPGRNRIVVWDELQELRAERAVFARTEPPLETAYAISEGVGKDSHIHQAGDPRSKGPEVRRGFLQILGGAKLPPSYEGSGRRLLADWIADEGNPLTARVMVNRIWHHHFGTGLVNTTSDFGVRGTPPTHPELLDYLARYFIDSGWSVKAMHRLIVHSRAYRQVSSDTRHNFDKDPQNRLVWRFNRRRLDAEQIRDSILAFSGDLDLSKGGRHPFPHRRTYFYRQHEPFAEHFPTNRRSVYIMQGRIQKNPYLDLFDGPDGNLPMSERKATTTTLQALFLMNSEFMHEQAQAMAERWSAELPVRADFLERATETIFARPPSPQDAEQAASYFATASGTQEQKRAGYLRAMLASNEFLFVD
ncbi:MAG: PSD1 and planctomycete cytochrome C domain-containing protein [Bryobacterales bacterium]|nr:PSD1 and planctomycete cytochrome C domain-containing protein [Bryobacterales bacterium]